MSFGIQSVGSGSQPPNPFSANGPFSNLNLSSQQQQQLQSIFSQAQQQGSSPSQVQSQVNSVLTSSQQQTLQSDLQTAKSHHHHHGSGASSSDSALSQLGLSSDQENQINQLIQNAQQNGTSSSDVLGQIDNVLTSNQQSQLAQILGSTGSYTSSGSSSGSNTNSYLVNTAA
jgi:Spy/CpxP family protein refolding chaperone